MAILGKGVLTWGAPERRTDRYGAVYLMREGANSFATEPEPSLVDEAEAKQFSGFKGFLFAEVTEARKSTHIGDLFRGFFPETPAVGERIALGHGTLFVGPGYHGGIVVGLKPDDGRARDWLDPKALYRAHEQSVILTFEPAD